MKALRFTSPLVILFFLLTWLSCPAAYWKSSQWGCEVNLPDGSYVSPWATMVPTPDSDALAGARSNDYSEIVYLGLVHLDDKPHFQLTQKTVGQLQNPFFGGNNGFLHDVQPVTRGKLSGFRLTGTHHYNGINYEAVVEMYQANGLVYQIAGLSSKAMDPLKDPNIRSFMDSFRITPIR
jgi:hypothetical protein